MIYVAIQYLAALKLIISDVSCLQLRFGAELSAYSVLLVIQPVAHLADLEGCFEAYSS